MWFTLLNRTKRKKNLYKEALKLLFEERAENMILAYGYVNPEFGDSYGYGKNKVNIFEKLVQSGVKKIILIGSNESGIINFKEILKKIEEADIKKEIEIVIMYDKEYCIHKKLAIRYSDKEVVGAILGSSNLTKACLYDAKKGYFQKNLDVIFGNKNIIEKIGREIPNDYYEKLLEEVGENKEKNKILKDKAVSVEADILIQQLIKEVELDLDENYMFIYANKKYIEGLDNKTKEKVVVKCIEALEYIKEAEIRDGLQNIYEIIKDDLVIRHEEKNNFKLLMKEIEGKNRVDIMNCIIKKIKAIPKSEDKICMIMNLCSRCLLSAVFKENIAKMSSFKKSKDLIKLKKEIVVFYKNLNYIEKKSESKWEEKVKRLEEHLKEKNKIEDVEKAIQESVILKKVDIKGKKAIDILLETLK